MTRARMPIVAAALMVASLAASNAGAQNPPTGHYPPGTKPPAPPASASAEPERGPIREFFHRLRTQGKKGHSGHSDWSTGGDAKLSKPWLR
jgi:hypothetical protein